MLRKTIIGTAAFVGFMGSLPHLLYYYGVGKLRAKRKLAVVRDKLGPPNRRHLQDPERLERLGYKKC